MSRPWWRKTNTAVSEVVLGVHVGDPDDLGALPILDIGQGLPLARRGLNPPLRMALDDRPRRLAVDRDQQPIVKIIPSPTPHAPADRRVDGDRDDPSRREHAADHRGLAAAGRAGQEPIVGRLVHFTGSSIHWR